MNLLSHNVLFFEIGGDSDRDMTGGFTDLIGASLGARTKSSQGGSAIGVGFANHEASAIEPFVMLGISCCRSQLLSNRVTRAIGHEFEHDQRFSIGSPPNLV